MTTGTRPVPLPFEVRRTVAWRDPLSVAAGLSKSQGALCLLSDPALPASRSVVAAGPDSVQIFQKVEGRLFEALRAGGLEQGVVGLASYDAGARPATGDRGMVWPDLIVARYPSMIIFHHDTAQVEIIGRGVDERAAERAASLASDWIEGAIEPGYPSAPSRSVNLEAEPGAYRQAVASVVERIAAGELFQANVARGWQGELNPGTDPFEVLVRLAAHGGAAFGAFWRIGDLCLVSNSPELFVTLRYDGRASEAGSSGGGRVETRPIKGTRPRGSDQAADDLQAKALSMSAKDRAENLMIVDLMRNDLSRVCSPGTVKVTGLFDIERLPTVHHLVSTVVGQLKSGLGPADLLDATFPPGSITGAPKHQAMKVIASLEPPRGAWCGSLFLLDPAGDLTASVLIRTVAFTRIDGLWTWRAQAGAGIVADSDPEAELEETRVKFKALSRALCGHETDGL